MGKPNKIIAYQLGVSEATVKVHVQHIFKKLGVTNRTQAAVAGKPWTEFPDDERDM